MGLSSIAKAMRGHWLSWFHPGAPSTNDETLTIKCNEAKRRSTANECLTPVSINSINGPNRITMAGDKGVTDSDDEDNRPTINDVESLKKGIIKTSKNKANTPYTILLVGETGVGKSSVLEFFANILIGNDIGHCDFDILDRTNEQGGSDGQSQTKSARLYEFTSKNGITVRILDTPGLADTRSVQQDELHKRSIVTKIKGHLDSITAVLILANGTAPRVTVGTDYALSTLSDMFPKSLARNVSFMFTNVLSPLHWNFSSDSVPYELQDAPQFLLNNPIALQRKLQNVPNMNRRRYLRDAVKTSEQNALQMLVELFDWLDGLEPQATTEIVTGSERREATSTNHPSPMEEVSKDSARTNQLSLLKILKLSRLRRAKEFR